MSGRRVGERAYMYLRLSSVKPVVKFALSLPHIHLKTSSRRRESSLIGETAD